MRASYDHHSVPIPRRAVGRVLEIQAGAIGLVVRDYLAAIGGFILATFLALFNYLTPSGARHGVRSRGGSDAECDRANCRDPGQAERAGEGQRRAVSNRPGAVPVQGRAVAGLARSGKAAGRDPEIELRAGNGECQRAHHAGRLQQKRLADIQTLAADEANTQF
jgi:hypothetical protein